jgi:DNA polymerase I-like protein with 3'-5' exonuclease and polymerase domains
MFLDPDKEELYIGFDIESLPITDKQPYPKPVAFSTYTYIELTEQKKESYVYEDVEQELAKLYDHCEETGSILVGHNLSYDFTCIKHHFGIDFFQLDYEDTMTLAWLVNPELNPDYGELKLKNLSHKWCQIPPDEEEEIKHWLFNNQESFYEKYLNDTKGGDPFFKLEPKDTRTKKKGDLIRRKLTWSGWGGFLCEAPLELLKPYAIGDSYRTYTLFMHIVKKTHLKNDDLVSSIRKTYLRELRLQELLARRTLKGIRLDVAQMKEDKQVIEEWVKVLWADLSDLLGITAISQKQLIPALLRTGVVKKYSDFKIAGNKNRDDQGRLYPSISAEALELASDHVVMKDLILYQRLKKFKSTYINNWLDRLDGDRIHMSFFTLLNTGRISAGNLSNIPKRKAKEVIKCSPKYAHMQVPRVRKYILPDSDDHVLVVMDYAAQEIRQLAHFLKPNTRLPQEFINNPRVDIHQRTVDIFRDSFGLHVVRDDSKAINFGIVYGLGLPALAKKMKRSLAEASRFLDTYYETFTGVKTLIKTVKNIVEGGGFIRTIGKRKFYLRDTRAYKYMNYLIQGSSSDQTKAAIVKHGTVEENGRFKKDTEYVNDFLMPLHDEGVFSIPKSRLHRSMVWARNCMEHCGLESIIPFKVDIEIRKHNYDR